jgi:thiamine-phosphate pyrophosphorylase
MQFVLSPLYPILDASCLVSLEDAARLAYLRYAAAALAEAGVTMLQYRNKHESDAQVLREAAWLREHAPASLRILLNDRSHLVRQACCDGVHVGQSDLHPDEARAMLGPGAILGLSTHSGGQVRAGDETTADYLAIGPVYPTGSKADAEAVIGLDGLRAARALTAKPLVAIGGITLARAQAVRAAGADSVAVISALFGSPDVPLAKLAGDFLEVFR